MQNSIQSFQNKTITNYPVHSFSGKTLQNQSKALEGNESGCAQWIEQNNDIYNGIMNGTSELSKSDQAQFMEWYQYAYQTAFASQAPAWGESGEPAPNSAPSNLPEGAKVGARNNIVFNQESADTTYAANAMPIDVLSDTFTLNVDVKLRGKISVEKTTDTRIQPVMPVIKITVSDPDSNPAETVYFVNPDAKIAINTLGAKGVDLSGDLQGATLDNGDAQITVGTYQASSAVGPDSSLPGVEDKDHPGTFTYKPDFEGETVDFQAAPGGDQKHVVWANANISCKPGDHANVALDGASGDLTITVTHDDSDQSSDTYIVKKGYTANVNINKEYITFGADAKSAEDGKLPKDLIGRLTVNGKQDVKIDVVLSEEATDAQQTVQALLNQAGGKSEDDLMQALKDAGINEFGSLEEFYDAVANKQFPPTPLSYKAVKFFYYLDKSFADALDAGNSIKAGPDNFEQRQAADKKATERFVALLDNFDFLGKPKIDQESPNGFTIGDRQYYIANKDGQKDIDTGWMYVVDDSDHKKRQEWMDHGDTIDPID